MKTAEEILTDNFDIEYFPGAVFGDFAYEYETVISAMKLFAEEHIKQFKAELISKPLLYFAKDTNVETGILHRTYDGHALQNLTLREESINELYPLTKII